MFLLGCIAAGVRSWFWVYRDGLLLCDFIGHATAGLSHSSKTRCWDGKKYCFFAFLDLLRLPTCKLLSLGLAACNGVITMPARSQKALGRWDKSLGIHSYSLYSRWLGGFCVNRQVLALKFYHFAWQSTFGLVHTIRIPSIFYVYLYVCRVIACRDMTLLLELQSSCTRETTKEKEKPVRPQPNLK